ncbi:ATP-grasp fold amidoligase family protein [uncultured Enorma sp.]|uniref:ATP-grasp fold amidoligase family protein n=1 Tax=uncultured Enorma sp. TaxID=1714346 RepID=UPI0026DB4B1C|nr:ATP-grasp fold amidoligase family protein [uncultured Enorma sp.]
MSAKDIAKLSYGCFLQGIRLLFNDDSAKEFDSFLRFRRRLNLKRPRSLADKVSYLELHTNPDMRARCTDKYEVRAYLEEKGVGDILTPLVMNPVSRTEDISFKGFPSEYVLKATHGCGMNIIHTKESHLDEERERAICRKWLRSSYGKYSMEPHYQLIPPRIFAEEYLGVLDELIDFKIHCYNGEPSFVLTVSERSTGLYKLHAFTCDWTPIECVVGPHRGDGSIKRPCSLEKMLDIARVLSEDFEFVRVDLYELNGQIRFGELTFTPAACVFPYFSKSFLEAEGRKLSID